MHKHDITPHLEVLCAHVEMIFLMTFMLDLANNGPPQIGIICCYRSRTAKYEKCIQYEKCTKRSSPMCMFVLSPLHIWACVRLYMYMYVLGWARHVFSCRHVFLDADLFLTCSDLQKKLCTWTIYPVIVRSTFIQISMGETGKSHQAKGNETQPDGQCLFQSAIYVNS